MERLEGKKADTLGYRLILVLFLLIAYQIRTLSSGFKYMLSPSCTSKAS